MHFWFSEQVSRIEEHIDAFDAKYRTLNVKVHPAMSQSDWRQLIDRMTQCSESLLSICKEIGEAVTES